MRSEVAKLMRVVVVNTSLETPYHSYGDHWIDGFKDAGYEVDVYKYEDIKSIPSGYDLYFFVDIRYRLSDIPAHARPRVVFSFDAHCTGVSLWQDASQYFDFVALASKREAILLSGAIGRRSMWVPEAYNKRIHTYSNTSQRAIKIGYIGNSDSSFPRNGITKDMIRDFIAKEYEDIYFDLKLKQGPNAAVFGTRYSDLLNKIVINVDWPMFHNLGTRVFESMACGCALLRMETSDDCGLHDFFVPNEHYIPYLPTINSFKRAVETALADDGLIAKKVAENGRAAVESHTYANRAKHVMEYVKTTFGG